MALVLKKLYQNYERLHDETDDRSRDCFFVSSLLCPIVIVLSYLYIVTDFGPRFMKNRPAFGLKSVMISYNIVQIFANALIVYFGLGEMLRLDWFCSPVDYQNMLLVKLSYGYFLLKILDLLDTIFFVFRKKHGHISFLHVYHHAAVIWVAWTLLKFWAGGHSMYLVVINSLVHTIMYSYYLMAIWWPEYKSIIWIKKWITIAQIVQFAFYIVTYGQLLFRPDCAYPKIISYACVPQNMFMFLLFSDFYHKTYVKTNKPKSINEQNLIHNS